ncbi:MAG TPA: GNAT family N-acetyltransferase, partial [Thermoplasmata archaeon]|nr:GNAT family N-acetyltransferase [Thermoplasmata archaeon]
MGLSGNERDRAIPCLRDSFVGVYRWHAKRTLRDVERVRAISDARGDIVEVAMTEVLVPEAGYVYYIAVSQKERRQGLAGLLLDEAMDDFRERGA